MHVYSPVCTIAAGITSSLATGGEANTAAILCGYNNFSETDFFLERSTAPLKAGVLEYEDHLRGIPRVIRMLTSCLQDVQQQLPSYVNIRNCPWLITLPDTFRSDWTAAKHQQFLEGVFFLRGNDLTNVEFHRKGRAGLGDALISAAQLLHQEGYPYVLLIGVDALVNDEAIHYFGSQNDDYRGRLLSERDTDGFIPGECVSAVCLSAFPSNTQSQTGIVCRGVGMGLEPVTMLSGGVLRGEGLTQAIRQAADSAQCDLNDTLFRIIGLTGESYFFREAAIVLPRVLSRTRPEYPLWHTVDKLGEIGAATGPTLLAFLHWAALKDQLPGRLGLGHISNDDEARMAFIFSDAV